MNNAEYYYDESHDNELLLDVNNIDESRAFAGDPFDMVALIEAELGHPLACH